MPYDIPGTVENLLNNLNQEQRIGPMRFLNFTKGYYKFADADQARQAMLSFKNFLTHKLRMDGSALIADPNDPNYGEELSKYVRDMGIDVAEEGFVTKAELNAARGREGMEKAYAKGNIPHEEYMAATKGLRPIKRQFKPKEPAQL